MGSLVKHYTNLCYFHIYYVLIILSYYSLELDSAIITLVRPKVTLITLTKQLRLKTEKSFIQDG